MVYEFLIVITVVGEDTGHGGPPPFVSPRTA
jgi:hypothetical protein